jgi:hypothetical protein
MGSVKATSNARREPAVRDALRDALDQLQDGPVHGNYKAWARARRALRRVLMPVVTAAYNAGLAHARLTDSGSE